MLIFIVIPIKLDTCFPKLGKHVVVCYLQYTRSSVHKHGILFMEETRRLKGLSCFANDPVDHSCSHKVT